jgi:hypothetical protein
MKRTGTRPKIVVTADGRGVVGHAGTRLLADLADASGLSTGVSVALESLRQRESGHDPGRIAVDLAVMLADGGEAICDLAVLRNQPDLFGSVASAPTAWRVLAALDEVALEQVRAARAQARELAWAQAAETGRLPFSIVAGYTIPGLVLDLDATIVICHSEKEQASKTWKRTFGYHPLLCFLDATGEALAGMFRPGRAGSNTTADHITVLDRALAQVPDAHRYGTDILIRSDSAGASHGFLAYIRTLREQGVQTFFSIGIAITEGIRTAISACVDWQPAIDTDGDLRDGAQIAEIPPTRPVGLPHRHPRHRAPGTAAPRRATVPVRHRRRAAPPGLHHRHPTAGLLGTAARGAPPRPRPRGRPHPHRQGLRVRPLPVPDLRDQRRLARTRPDRHRPARLDPHPAPGRRTRPGRA